MCSTPAWATSSRLINVALGFMLLYERPAQGPVGGLWFWLPPVMLWDGGAIRPCALAGAADRDDVWLYGLMRKTATGRAGRWRYAGDYAPPRWPWWPAMARSPAAPAASGPRTMRTPGCSSCSGAAPSPPSRCCCSPQAPGACHLSTMGFLIHHALHPGADGRVPLMRNPSLAPRRGLCVHLGGAGAVHRRRAGRDGGRLRPGSGGSVNHGQR